MTVGSTALLIDLAVLALTLAVLLAIVGLAFMRLLDEHRAALAAMRHELKTYDLIRSSGGIANGVRLTPALHDPGAAALTLYVPGLTLKAILPPAEIAETIWRLHRILERKPVERY